MDIKQVDAKITNGYLEVDIVSRMYQGRRVDRDAGDEVAAAKGARQNNVRGVIVDLFEGDRAELDDCQAAHRAEHAIIKNHSLIVQPGGPGAATVMWVLKHEWFMGALAQERTAAAAAAAAALDALCAALPRMIASSKSALGAMAPADNEYPTEEFMRQKFSNTIIGPHVPRGIGDIDRASIPSAVTDVIADEMIEARAKQIEDTIKRSLDGQRDILLDNLSRMATTMQKVHLGEKTKVFNSLTSNLATTVAKLRANNLFESAKAERVCAAIEKALLARPAGAYKKTPEMAGKLAAVATKLSTIVAQDDFLF